MWSRINYPLYIYHSRKWKKVEISKQIEILNLKQLSMIKQSMPKNICNDNKQKPIDYLISHLDENTLNNDENFLLIAIQVATSIKLNQPFIAKDFIDKALQLSKKLYSKYNPQLIKLYQLKADLCMDLGDIDELNICINKNFLLTLINYKFYSEETLLSFDYFRKFSFKIEEKEEHDKYCFKMEEIIHKLLLDKHNSHNLNILTMYMNILDTMTNFTSKFYSIDNLKRISKIYENVKKMELFSDVNNIRKLSINDHVAFSIYHINYCNIKVKYFLKKEKEGDTLKELDQLYNYIQQDFGNYHHLLINPYLFNLRLLFRSGDKELFETFITEKWFDLLDNLFENNILHLSNYSLLVVHFIATRDKHFKKRINNLMNFVGDNYNTIFNFTNDEKRNTNFLYGEICYYAAYINRDDLKLNPLLMADSAAYVYNNVLGGQSNKLKKAIILAEEISKQYNLNKK